jgi:CubicO group peptidase (beta-lactamase class C family)
MNRPAIKLLAFVALALANALIPAAYAKSLWLDTETADRIVREEMRKQNIPGVAITLLHDGKIVHQTGFGMADLEHRIPVDAQTAFSIGSLSKQFIASGIMLLEQDGKIDLDAKVANYIGDAPDAWSKITIRHLLTHTSGLVRETPGFRPDQEQSDIDLIRTAYGVPLLFEPGEKFEYCNTGYFILAEIIARISGMPWPEFFQVRIFRPLGMTATRVTSLTDIIAHRSGGYDWTEGHFANVLPYRALRPSGAFVSTETDMAKWEQALTKPGLLTKRSLETMWTRMRLNSGDTAPYGFGWRLESVNGAFEISHGGSLPGFRSFYARYPEKHLSIIVLTNSGSAEPRDIARAIAATVRSADPRGE